MLEQTETIINLLTDIYNQLSIFSNFVQFFIYGIFILVIIYFGYWFFSRFFY